MSSISPRLPQELVDEVVFRAWELQCPVTERILLMTTLPRVSRGVLATYVRISSVDVHIPCPSFVNKFIRWLREGARGFPIIQTAGNAAELCRSITLQVVQPRSPIRAVHWSAEPPMGVALSDLLYNLRVFGDLPNFRTLTILYNDVDLNDIFDWARFIDFPKTVELLNLEFVWTEAEIPPKIVITPPGCSPNIMLWTLPSIRHLRVLGGNEEFVSRLVSSIPNLESLDDGLGGIVQSAGGDNR